MNNVIFLDCEVYPNFFLISFESYTKRKIVNYDMHNEEVLGFTRKTVTEKIRALMAKRLTVGFNSNNYDLLIIAAFLDGYSNQKLYELSSEIVTSNDPGWMIAKRHNLRWGWDHIDLFNIPIGQASLKIYGARLGCKNLQDLPFNPLLPVDDEQVQVLRDYCGNDLALTRLLYEAVLPQIKIRVGMSDQYDLDLRSKSDAQIAEAVLKSECTKELGQLSKPTPPTSIRYKVPDYIKFISDELNERLEAIRAHVFELRENGSVKLPSFITKTDVRIKGVPYRMGIGGLHSCEKAQYLEAKDGMHLIDMDVTSYYPSIILNHKLEPSAMKGGFTKVYDSIVKRRVAAKDNGDKATADTLKIVINGSFGKLGSKYSALYSPDLLIQVTLTGQLALLMLIERCAESGIRVVSANTDGVVFYVHDNDLPKLDRISFYWMLDTLYNLEATHYKFIASRDVNNYVAMTTSGALKTKGVFAKTCIAKNPDTPIVPAAVAQYLAHRAPIENTIRSCDNPFQFCKVRQVTGGALFKESLLGKAVRFFYSADEANRGVISYAENGNKVPQSDNSEPLMRLSVGRQYSFDYDRYISAAEELLKGVGFNANT